jgi:hypothetical protein
VELPAAKAVSSRIVGDGIRSGAEDGERPGFGDEGGETLADQVGPEGTEFSNGIGEALGPEPRDRRAIQLGRERSARAARLGEGSGDEAVVELGTLGAVVPGDARNSATARCGRAP